MPAPVTRAVILTRVRERACCEGDDLVTDTEINDLINQALTGLWDRLVDAWGQEYYRRTAELATVAGTALYALPADFYKVLTVMVNPSVPAGFGAEFEGTPHPEIFQNTDHDIVGGWRECEAFGMGELARLLNTRTTTPHMTRYRTRGVQLSGPGALAAPSAVEQQLLELRPTPRTSFFVRLEYLPTAPQFFEVGEEDDPLTIDFINGWEEWVILTVAIVILGKEETDASHLMVQKQEIDARIVRLAGSRSAGRPERVRDADPQWGYSRGRGECDGEGWWP